MTNKLHDDEINAKIKSLNFKQRKIFCYLVLVKDYLKNLNLNAPKSILPLHLFVRDCGGIGKSHLIKTIYHFMTKLF